jgi:phosphoglycerate kinase
MAGFKTLDDLGDITGKKVLVRVDLNVPMSGGAVADDTRIRAAMPTIRELSDKGAIVLLLAHFGRPKGAKNPTQSLSLVIDGVADVLGHSVMFIPECVGEGAKAGVAVLAAGDVAVLENTRFHKGEEKNNPDFTAALAANGDLYINDAFSAAHRAHASTEGLAHLLPAYAGRTMQAELEALEKGLGNPARPVVAIVGGAKVSTKIDLLMNLVKQGRRAGHRRRHGEHLPRRPRHQCRQIALRA